MPVYVTISTKIICGPSQSGTKFVGLHKVELNLWAFTKWNLICGPSQSGTKFVGLHK